VSDRDELGIPAKDKRLTRREVLKRGAAAGVGLGLVGLEGDVGGAPGAEGALPQQVCTTFRGNCPSTPVRPWAVPASVINVLWGDFWPRYIALWWERGAPITPPVPAPFFGFGSIGGNALTQAMTALVAVEAAATVPPVTPPASPAGWRLTRFQKRMKLIYDHIQGPAPIPLTFVGEGGYDFVLSDVGLELFAPAQPLNDFEYMRYYSFRSTGRPSLGVPLYLEKADLALELDAPTGPSQILSTQAGLNDVTANSTGCKLGQLNCFCPQVWRGEKPDRDRQFSFQSFLAATESVRQWQLEGAVYRGILTELPRVIAEIWLERLQGATAPNTYNSRFFPGSLTVREIFKERLETSLPESNLMTFDVDPLALDVRVTNDGLYLPPVPSMPAGSVPGVDWDTASNAPLRNLVLREIASGHAGNPVFTNSQRPENGG